jgi:dihydrofolate reductase
VPAHRRRVPPPPRVGLRGSLIYSAIASLDGYIEDEDGTFGWAEPDEEVHRFINELERPVGTYLYGRRMYETMVGWETEPAPAERSPVMREFAEIWQAAEKIVYSGTLTTAPTRRTRIERAFDADAVRALKSTAERELAIGGAELAAQAFRDGLVDEVHLFVVPVIVGGGKRCLPEAVRLDLDLLDERRFDAGMVFLRYSAQTTNRPTPVAGDTLGRR